MTRWLLLLLVLTGVAVGVLWQRCGLKGCPDVDRLRGNMPDRASAGGQGRWRMKLRAARSSDRAGAIMREARPDGWIYQPKVLRICQSIPNPLTLACASRKVVIVTASPRITPHHPALPRITPQTAVGLRTTIFDLAERPCARDRKGIPLRVYSLAFCTELRLLNARNGNTTKLLISVSDGLGLFRAVIGRIAYNAGLRFHWSYLVTAAPFCIGLSMASMAAAQPAPTQELVLAEAFCRRCTLALVQRVRIGTVDGAGALTGPPSSISSDGSGNFYVTEFGQRSRVQVFARDGRFTRSLGRAGSGPGEFSVIKQAVVTLDSALVFDIGLRRATIAAIDGGFSRTVPFPAPDVFDVAQITDSVFVVSAVMLSKERAGLPLHVFHKRARLQESFGSAAGIFRPTTPWLNMRAVAPAQGGRVWSARQTAYEIERWMLGGERELVLRRQVNWFRPWVDRSAPGEPPNPSLMAVHEVEPGTLAVLIAVPAADYKKRLGPGVRQGDRIVHDYSRRKALFDTVIEIVDVQTKTVIYSERVDDSLSGFVSGSSDKELWTYAYDTIDGIPHIDLWVLTFNRR